MPEPTFLKHEIRKGTYFDSAVLMHLQRALVDLPGIVDAGVVMATKANLELLADSGLLPVELEAVNPEDLLLVVQGDTEREADGALGRVDELLKRRASPVSGAFLPRSLETAAKMLPSARWVLISVPGQFAAQVARQALERRRHVFLYSDNVSLEDEIKLKEQASHAGLFVMGPDCGTAFVNGVGFGFANRVRRGEIGLVGASGTGLQAVMVYIHELGGGVSQAIGTGGRDLHEQVGGVTAAQALDALSRDEETRVVVLISKPPAEDVLARLDGLAQAAGKPVVVYYQGMAPPGKRLGNCFYGSSLEETARIAVDLSRKSPSAHSQVRPRGGFVRGLFSGGTLAYESLLMLQNSLTPLYSNVPLRATQRLENNLESKGHTILDLGADEFTVGRLHPMIDNDLRARRLRQEGRDPDVGLILLDVVLGEGAHPDPAAELAPVIEEITNAGKVDVVVILLGTDEDGQGVDEQEQAFRLAGASVYRHIAQAIDHVIASGAATPPDIDKRVDLEVFRTPVAAINLGLESFYGSLIAQGVEALHVDWRPPAGGDQRLLDILQKMKAAPGGDTG